MCDARCICKQMTHSLNSLSTSGWVISTLIVAAGCHLLPKQHRSEDECV